MAEKRTEAFPDYLYVDSYDYISASKGTVKEFRYVLKLLTREEHYIQDLFSLYKLTGIDLKQNMRQYLDTYDEVILDYRSAAKINTFREFDSGVYHDLAVYKVVGRHVQNPNRVFINQKTKDTIAKREKMAADIPMLVKVTNGKVTVDRRRLLEYINEELKKKGYDPLPERTTYVDVD